MVVTLGQQYNIGEKPTVILYTYINLLWWVGRRMKLVAFALPDTIDHTFSKTQHIVTKWKLQRAEFLTHAQILNNPANESDPQL